MGATPSSPAFPSCPLGTRPSPLLAPFLGLFLSPYRLLGPLSPLSATHPLLSFLQPLRGSRFLSTASMSVGLRGIIPTSPFFSLLVLSLKPPHFLHFILL